VIDVAEFTMKLVAGVDPKLTEVAPTKELPVTLTEVPPLGDPFAGERPVTTGVGLM
jgi:hypothetical protein